MGPLYRELVEKENVETGELTAVTDTEFDSCVIRKCEEKQTLIAVAGKQIIRVEYSGRESLIGKTGRLEKMIEGD